MYKKCIHCSKDLGRSATYRKKFCDARCRVAYNRRKKKPKGYSLAMDGISLLGTVQKKDKKYAIDALKALKKAIDVELRNLGDADAVEKYEMFNARRIRRN